MANKNANTPFFGWHEAKPTSRQEKPQLLATLQAPRRNGAIVEVYSDGSLAYQFPPNPKWIWSRITVYSQVNRGLIGSGETLTPEQFIERHMARGYTQVKGERG